MKISIFGSKNTLSQLVYSVLVGYRNPFIFNYCDRNPFKICQTKFSPNYLAHVDLRGGGCVSWKCPTVVVDPLGGFITHAASDWRSHELGNNSICISSIHCKGIKGTF
jgi:hypothetical protein